MVEQRGAPAPNVVETPATRAGSQPPHTGSRRRSLALAARPPTYDARSRSLLDHRVAPVVEQRGAPAPNVVETPAARAGSQPPRTRSRRRSLALAARPPTYDARPRSLLDHRRTTPHRWSSREAPQRRTSSRPPQPGPGPSHHARGLDDARLRSLLDHRRTTPHNQPDPGRVPPVVEQRGAPAPNVVETPATRAGSQPPRTRSRRRSLALAARPPTYDARPRSLLDHRRTTPHNQPDPGHVPPA
jgi:hypothetical protein